MDLICREELLHKLNTLQANGLYGDAKTYENGLILAQIVVKDMLPAAHPDSATAHWVYLEPMVIVCSRCGWCEEKSLVKRRYCSMCGATMCESVVEHSPDNAADSANEVNA